MESLESQRRIAVPDGGGVIAGGIGRFTGSALICLALGSLPSCGDAPAGPLLELPPRPKDAPGGAEVASDLRGLDLAEREERIYSEVARGNVPDWLRRLEPVEISGEAEGGEAAVTVWVTPDYLSVGSESDYFYVPLSPRTAGRIAELVGGSLPTPTIVDAVWKAARTRLAPIRIRPGEAMWGIRYLERHSRLIRAQAQQHGARPGRLVAGHKLDVVRPPPPVSDTAEAALYGWHRRDGTPIQPLHAVEPDSRPHFSMGVRLVHRLQERSQ